MTALIPTFPDGRPAPFFLTVEELAEFCRLDVRFPADSVRRWRERGLKARQVGKRVMFCLDEVIEYMQSERNLR